MINQLDKIEIEDKRRKVYKEYKSIVKDDEDNKSPYED